MKQQLNTLLIATSNKGKLSEISKLLEQINVKTIGSFEYNLEAPEENGVNFYENSLIKSKYYAQKTNLISLADDSGLCIDLLNKKPGIHSARWAINENNEEKDFDFAFEKIKQELENKNIDIKNDKITAYFICNLSIYNPRTTENISFEGRVDGLLTFPKRGTNGFGYDPIFIPNGYQETFGEMGIAQKEKISHRSEAFRKLLEWYY